MAKLLAVAEVDDRCCLRNYQEGEEEGIPAAAVVGMSGIAEAVGEGEGMRSYHTVVAVEVVVGHIDIDYFLRVHTKHYLLVVGVLEAEG